MDYYLNGKGLLIVKSSEGMISLSGPILSILRIICDIKSCMSGNIFRMASGPNTGIKMRWALPQFYVTHGD
jgi:hypothetical protein